MESVETAHGRPRLGSAASLRMPPLLPMSGGGVAERLEFRLESRQLLVGHVLHVDEGVSGSRDRPDELIQLELRDTRLTILRILDKEHHEKRDHGRASVDDQLPGIRVAERWLSLIHISEPTRLLS